MTDVTVDGRVIMIGYEWRMRVEVVATPVLFPAGSTLAAHVRASRSASATVATLTTGSGLTRASDTEIDIVLSPAQTAAMAAGTVVMDVVRTDVAPDQHLGFALTIPVLLPVTRGLPA